jgi:hypothetical protein
VLDLVVPAFPEVRLLENDVLLEYSRWLEQEAIVCPRLDPPLIDNRAAHVPCARLLQKQARLVENGTIVV